MTTLLFSLAALGFVFLVVQRVALAVALSRPARAPRGRAPLSILKPLCGLDDALEDNLAALSALDGDFEVLLGVKDRADAAYPLAAAFAVRDARFRVVVQRGSPGLNPKVNQLATLAAEACHELLLVSDSNARLVPGALDELRALAEDPRVACVTQPVSGAGHRSFGALLDNFHLAASIGAGQVAAKLVSGKDVVVGKSMLVRRAALARLGGFAAYADVLAEDFVIGQDLRRAGWAVRVSTTPVWNVAVDRTVHGFFERYLRWGVIHRTAVSLPTSLAQGLLNPLPFLVLGAALEPSLRSGLALGPGLLLKVVLDVGAARALRCEVDWRLAVPAVVVKDLLIFVTWARGLVVRTVTWRGNRLRVGARSRLVRATSALRPAHAEAS